MRSWLATGTAFSCLLAVVLYFPGGMNMHAVRDIGLFSIFAMLGVGHPLDRARRDYLHARLLGRRRRG